MRKLIICDKNKKVTDAVSKMLKEYGFGIFDSVEVINGDIIQVHEITPNSKIVTASNPRFSPDGGLDALLAKKYGFDDAREFNWNEHLFFVKSVDNNRNSTKDILLRAAVGILGFSAKHTLIMSGLGTGVGGLAVDAFVDVVTAIVTNLRSADLSSADLRYANLRSADLRSANLSSANLSSANLSYAKNCHLYHDNLVLLRFQTGNLKAYKYVTEEGYSPINGDIHYEVGKIVTEDDFDADDFEACGTGLNVATLEWCLREHGTKPILEVEFLAKDIVSVPFNTDGKFRVKKLKVLRKLTDRNIESLLKKTRSYYQRGR